MIFTEIKNVLMSFYSKKAEHEALAAYDFKLLEFKPALMRLCFSPLANWPLFLLAIILYYNPFRYQFQLLGGATQLLPLLYSPQWAMGLSIGMILSYFAGLINWPIALVLYLISQGEVHTILGGSILAGIFLGRILKHFKLVVKLEGTVKKMTLYFGLIQVLSLPLAIWINLNIYQYMFNAGYFSRTLFAYRFEFMVISLMVYYATQLLVNSIWGHFYARRTEDPSTVMKFYSTSTVIRKLSLGAALKSAIKEKVVARMMELELQLRDAGTMHFPRSIIEAARVEQSYLDLARQSLK